MPHLPLLDWEKRVGWSVSALPACTEQHPARRGIVGCAAGLAGDERR
jgi:hypothetical protein